MLFKSIGDKSKPAILFFHAMGVTGDSSMPVAKYLEKELQNMDEIVLDMDELEYISSAGLRVLLMAQKVMNQKNGILKLIHVNEMIREVFEITGFTDILTIE